MSLTHADVIAVWGESGVIRVPSADISGSGLPDTAQRILVDVGLPREVEYLFIYERPARISSDHGRQHWKIGTDYGTDVCVYTDSGEVVSLSSSGQYPNRFVNSCLECFVEFLCRVVTERRKFLGLPDYEIDELVERLEAELRARDADAFEQPEHWWSVIFEQLRAGLL